jgi:hypothetical protein
VEPVAKAAGQMDGFPTDQALAGRNALNWRLDAWNDTNDRATWRAYLLEVGISAVLSVEGAKQFA